MAAKVSTGDIVHEVFVSVLRDEQAIPTRSDQAIAAYLGRLVRNRLVDTLRHHQAARRDSRRLCEIDSNVAEELRSPGSELVHAERMASFERALATFTERERAILQARLEDGMPFASVARTFGYKNADSARKAFHVLQARLATRIGRAGTK